MEVLGAAASALALAQLAVELAKALNSYTGAVSDSVDDIVVIADDISDTYGHLQQLATVLEKNEKTKLLNETAVSNAQRCVTRSQTLLNRLKKLFLKSGATSQKDSINPEQIDVSRFGKAIWIFHKSEFELRRAELHHIKADISLIYLTYLTMASGSDGTQKQQNIEQMKLVYARRTILDKDLKKARAKRNKDARSQRGLGSGYSYQPYYGAARHYDDYSDNEDQDGGGGPAAVYDRIEDLYSEFDVWLTTKREKEEQEIAERKLIEEVAVQKHLQQQSEAVEKIQKEMQKLKETLSQHGLPPSRIDQIVRDAYPQAAATQKDVGTSSPDTKSDMLPLRPNPQRAASSTSSWKRRFSKRSDDDAAARNTSDNLPDILRDPSAPGGLAQLKALYFQRVAVAPGRHEIMHWEVEVPSYRSIAQLLSGKQQPSQQTGLLALLQDFADVPDDYCFYVTKTLASWQNESDAKWTILQVETIKPRLRSRKFLRKRQEAILGVCVVLKKVPDIGDFSHSQYTASGAVQGNVQNNITEKIGLLPADPASRIPTVPYRTQPNSGTKHARTLPGADKGTISDPAMAYPTGYTAPIERVPSTRRTRFSNNVSKIPDPSRNFQPLVWASSDDESYYEELRPGLSSPRRRRNHTVERSSSEERQRQRRRRSRSRTPPPPMHRARAASTRRPTLTVRQSSPTPNYIPVYLPAPENFSTEKRTRVNYHGQRYNNSSDSDSEVQRRLRINREKAALAALEARKAASDREASALSRGGFDDRRSRSERTPITIRPEQPRSRLYFYDNVPYPAPHYIERPVNRSMSYSRPPHTHGSDDNIPYRERSRRSRTVEQPVTISKFGRPPPSPPTPEPDEGLPITMPQYSIPPADAVKELLDEWTNPATAAATTTDTAEDKNKSVNDASTTSLNPGGQLPMRERSRAEARKSPWAADAGSDNSDVVEVLESESDAVPLPDRRRRFPASSSLSNDSSDDEDKNKRTGQTKANTDELLRNGTTGDEL